MPSSRPTPGPRSGDDRTTELIRWAAFSCVLVPVVLLWYGASLAGTAGTAVGLAAVTAACRLLLRRSERCAARLPEEEHPSRAPHRGGRRYTGTGSRRGGRHSGGSTPVG
ncbi:hypothetical protein [Streptomyces sp. NPDC088766]|uniref:hypothetical protein n=1 Tax=Streptomyces sp. NPDC088766 TaxID=3365893 RepID=UPI003826C198